MRATSRQNKLGRSSTASSCRKNRLRLPSRSIRDLFVFTDRRLILVDKQGVTSRKINYLVVPYRAITSYSIETAGTLDMDSELKIWTSGRTDPIQKALKRGANIRGI